MIKIIAIIIIAATLAMSMNTIDAMSDATNERVQTYSGNRNVHSQLGRLEAEGY